MPSSNGGNIVVPVGVQLELKNVQDIISSLQKALENVKPETKGYSTMVRELTSAEKKASSLASKLKQGFSTNAGIQNFTRNFEDLIALVDTVNNKIKDINFDNLTLTAEQQAKIENFTRQIEAAKEAYNNLEVSKMQKAINSSKQLQQVFQNLKLDVNTVGLDNAAEKIKNKLNEINEAIKDNERKLKIKERTVTRNQAQMDEIRQIQSIFNPTADRKQFSDIFDQFGGFKDGGREKLAEWMKRLGFDNETIEKVKNTATLQLSSLQQEIDKKAEAIWKRRNKSYTTAQQQASDLTADLVEAKKEQKVLEFSAGKMEDIQNSQEIIEGKQQEKNAVEAVTLALKQYTEAILKSIKGDPAGNAEDLANSLDAVRVSGASAANELENLNQKTENINRIKRSISMWMGFTQVLRLTKTAIRNVIKDIRNLDKVMTEIAVVTNMSQSDLWAQMNTYQSIAKQYGVATTGVYQVSQIYYQQGLQTADVMALTNETLKMAKIAGLDYSKAADYMTVAIRGFKMEMTDAQKVVDVYSNLAAKSAVDTTELATAMSKTASSAAAVGSSFENTSAMIAMMVETTRESAENIGSALKSIISRYGEMKSDPSKLIDSEGEALSLNKVDKALQSVGISLQDANHQFRDFDDVILELSSKWDDLDKNSQRYIATIMAGNRQQSRFLALVSDYDRLSELYEEAANSEDAALAQTLKTMDSLETKIQNVKNAFQGFYGNLGLESLFKGALDVITKVLNRLNSMPKAFGKIPIAAIGMVANIINVIKNLAGTLITIAAARWQKISKIISDNIYKGYEEGTKRGNAAVEQSGEDLRNSGAPGAKKTNKKAMISQAAGQAISLVGAGISTAALTMGDDSAKTRGGWQIAGGALSGIGQGIATGAMISGLPGVIIGGLAGIAAALPGVIAGFNDLANAEKLAIKAAQEKVEKSKQETLLAKQEANNLDTAVTKLEKLAEARFDSNEAYQEWIDYKNQLVDQYPELLAAYDAEGNAVIDTATAYQYLAEKRREAAALAKQEKIDELNLQKQESEQIDNILNENKKIKIAGGDAVDKGLTNLTSLDINNQKGAYRAKFKNGNIYDFSQETFDKIFSYNPEKLFYDFQTEEGIETILDTSSLKLNLDNLKGIRESNDRNLQQLVGNLAYENVIKPISEASEMANTEFSADKIKKEVERISSNKNKTSEQIEDETYEYYMKLLFGDGNLEGIIAKAEKLGVLNEQIAQAEADLAEINSSFTDVVSSKTDKTDQRTLLKIEKSSLMKQLNQEYMKPFKEQLTNEQIDKDLYEEKQEKYVNSLIDLYIETGESTWSQIESLLSHPEKYTSKADFTAEVAKLFDGGIIPDDIYSGMIAVINNSWEMTNKDLQNQFKRNLTGSEIKNDKIQKAANRLMAIGNGDDIVEIAAENLNDISKQWTNLVSKQKNEAVATQNAEFLSTTYFTVGSMTKEANNTVAGILTNAELDTREGLQAAIDSLKQYKAEANLKGFDTKLLDATIQNLETHKDNLLLNLNTEIQSYVDSLSDAVKSVNQNYSKNTSGFDELKDANEILDKINARKLKSGQKQLKFTDVYKFDETLGKYVFTVEGLQEANNQVMGDLKDQYTDTIAQLNSKTEILESLKNESYFNSEMTKEDQIAKLKERSESARYSSEQRAIYGELVEEFKKSNLEWDAFYEAHKEELDQLKINAKEELEAATKMTEEAQKKSSFKALDYSGIVKGVKTFEEVKQAIITYEKSIGAQFKDEQDAEDFAKSLFNEIKKGGLTAASGYKRRSMAVGQFNLETYNEILNQPIEASKSLLDKLNKSLGRGTIQLTEAEKSVLGDKYSNRVSISAGELSEHYSKLLQNIADGIEQNINTIEEYNSIIANYRKPWTQALNEYADAFTSFITSGKIDAESINKLASDLRVKLKSDINFNDIKGNGINIDEFGNIIIEDYQKVLEWLGENITEDSILHKEEILGALDLSDISKIRDAAIQVENNIIDSIAENINNIKSAGLGKQINLTYLQNQLGDNGDKILYYTFGKDYVNGILTITNEVKARMYNSLSRLRNEFKSRGKDVSELEKILIEYTDSAISEFSDFTGKFTVSNEVAQLLASRSSDFEKELIEKGKITIGSIEQFVYAAETIYSKVNIEYLQGFANLSKLNNAYSNIVKNNLAQQTAKFDVLTSATNFDLSSLENFLNVYNKELSAYIDKAGNLKPDGLNAGLARSGINKYQIADWNKFVSYLGIELDKFSSEYIDAYISWLDSEINIAPNAKEALMTSLISDMEKLSYAQIGQIAKTFKMTVDDVLLLVENNGDNTFNGAALLNELQFDKHNQEFKQALTKQYSEITNNLTSALVSFVESGSDGKRTGLDFANLDKAVNDYTKAMRSLGEDVEIDLYNLKMRLVLGGESAVAAGQEIAKFGGIELSAQDIETLYRGAITRYINTIDTVVAKPGEIVDEATASIIKQAGGKVNELGTTGQYVVESAANLYEAYNDLLHRMVATGEATLADLNKVAALALENRDGEQQVIDALGDAAGMTFTRFGEILADAGIELTEDMINNLKAANIIKLMGGNKMQIIDFNAFADLMHWDANSEEYISAFKSYNDSLIEMNRQAERNILEEAESIADAKGGDWINITQLMSKLQEGFRYEGSEKISLGDSLQASIQKFGAKIEDGILKLDDSANISAIMQEIAQVAAESGGLLSSELAELADAVAAAIKGYADLISGAISGSLSDVQAEQLQDWASTNGIGKLNFTKTADGLKVATNQAFELVAALRQVDSMQGKLTFDNLVDSLSADKGGRFENISKTTAEIANTQKEIERISNNIADIEKRSIERQGQMSDSDKEKISNLRSQKSELQDQLNLYRQIQQRQSIDPSQYNFMDRDIPEVMQGPVNYWNSIGKAFSAMNESSKTGTMEIQDFYNIVNEMENLANTSNQVFDLAGYKIGGSASQAAQLIQDGMSKLTNIDGKGVKVNLNNLGVDFAAGADEAKKDFQIGIKSLADSQIAMLDAAIQVLEVVVAMEKLGDIDVDNNNVFSIGDIFKLDDKGNPIPEYTAEFQQYAADLLEAAKTNEDLRKGLENFSINGVNLKEMFEEATDGIKDLNISEEAYFAVMEAFVNAAKNGDYNLDTVQDSVWQILEQTLPDGSIINVGERTIVISGGTHLVIDWEKPETKEVLSELSDDVEEAKKLLEEDFKAWQNGTSDEAQMTRVLRVQGKLKINTDENGNETSYEYKGVEYKTKNECYREIAKDLFKEENSEGLEESTTTNENGEEVTTWTSTKKYKNRKVELKFDGAKKVYHSNSLNRDFGTLEELQQAEYDKMVEELEWGKAHGGVDPNNIEIPSYEQWLYQEWGFHVNTTTKFTNEDGTEIEDPSSDPKLQESLREFLSQGHDKIQKQLNSLEDDGTGHYTLKLPGMESITVDASSPEEAAAKLESEIKTLYAPMATSVTTGITEAFTATNEDNSNAVQEAITTAIQKALGTTIENENGTTVPIGEITLTPSGLKVDISQAGEPILTSEGGELKDVKIPVGADTDSAKETVDQFIKEEIEPQEKKPVGLEPKDAYDSLNKLALQITAPVNKNVDIYATLTEQYKTAIQEATKDADKYINIKTKGSVTTGEGPKAGNVALSKGTGRAMAAGKTLMGELGPELVVSHGRYFVVGQNGPEMVDLAEDAIVFNHLQTQQLLSKGKTSTHAQVVTNERKATSLATGNVGPAMASASEALAALKQLRAMWQSLASASLKDLGDMAGSGGGGGGGGGGDNNTKGVLKDIERWYNWLQQIEETQTKINKLTQEYNLLEKQGANSKDLVKNLKEQYKLLESNKKVSEDLASQQRKYRKTLLDQVNKGQGQYGLLSAFYGADSSGRLTLKSDKEFQKFVNKNSKVLKGGLSVKEGSKDVNFTAKSGLELYNKLQKKDIEGKLLYSAEDQLKILEDLGFGKYLKKDASGNELKTAEEKVEFFFNQIDSGKAEIEALTKSIEEQEQAALDDAIGMQEINEKIRELVEPLTGVTKGLEKWYNELKRIEAITTRINRLQKTNELLQKDQIANGDKIYQNYQNQIKALNEKKKANNDLLKKQEKERDQLVKQYKGLPINYDKKTGVATFSDKTYNKKIKTSYTDVKRTKEGYEIDTNGNYVDKEGKLRSSKTGKEVKGKEFGKQATETITGKTYNAKGKTLPQILKEITASNATGKVAFNAEQQYQILKSLGFEKYMQYDENGNKVYDDFGALTKEEMKAAVEAGIARIQGAADEINDLTSDINEITDQNLDIDSQQLDIQQTLIDNTIDLKNQLKDAVVQEHQDIIDQKNELKNAIQDAAEKTVKGLRDSLNKEKQLYDSDQKEKDLAFAQMKLAALQLSGGSGAQIRDAQKAVQDKQKDLYFDQREQAIESIEEANNTQVELLEEQINILQSTLDYQVKYGLIWGEVNNKLTNLTAEAIGDYIAKNTPSWAEQGTEEQGKKLTEVLQSAQIFKAEQAADFAEKIKEGINLSKINLSDESKTELEKHINSLGDKGLSLEEAIKSAKDKIDELIKKEKDQKINNAIDDLANQLGLSDKEKGKAKQKVLSEIDNGKTVEEAIENVVKDSRKSKGSSIVKSLTNGKYDKGTDKILNTKNLTNRATELFNQGLSKKDVEQKLKDEIRDRKKEIEKQGEDQKAANKVIKKINNIPAKASLKNENLIKDARSSYDSLTKDQKGLINSDIVKKLTRAETLIKQLKKQKEEEEKEKKEAEEKVAAEARTKAAEDAAKKTSSSSSTGNKASGSGQKKTQVNYTLVRKDSENKEGDSKQTNTPQVSLADVKKAVNTTAAVVSTGVTIVSGLKKIFGFSEGGVIDYTGLAMVHGSKTKPEYVFNSEQMDLLRQGLYNNVNLTGSLLGSLAPAISQMADSKVYDSINNSTDSVVIEHAEVNVNVDKVSSDYDSRKIGEQAMAEMVRIARKAGNRSVTRR